MLFKPYKTAQRATIAEWVSKVIMLSGQKRSSHSIRSESSIMRGVDLAMVIGLTLPHLKSVLKTGAVIFGEEILL